MRAAFFPRDVRVDPDGSGADPAAVYRVAARDHTRRRVGIKIGASNQPGPVQSYDLPPLKVAYDLLEPAIDAGGAE